MLSYEPVILQKSGEIFAECCAKLTAAMNNLVRLERQDEVAIIVVDNPPVNALGQDVYEGFMSAIDAIERDSSFKSAIILAAGRTFIAGADIKLLEAAARGDGARLYLGPLLTKIEDFRCPIV